MTNLPSKMGKKGLAAGKCQLRSVANSQMSLPGGKATHEKPKRLESQMICLNLFRYEEGILSFLLNSCNVRELLHL